jgi:hypothetical protein
MQHKFTWSTLVKLLSHTNSLLQNFPRHKHKKNNYPSQWDVSLKNTSKTVLGGKLFKTGI